MSTWVFRCWSCRQATAMQDTVKRSDECPHCRSDMHSCKNCQHYAPGAHNDCRETIAEYVADKERGNFCGMYQAFAGERAALTDAAAAKAKLEALFKKS